MCGINGLKAAVEVVDAVIGPLQAVGGFGYGMSVIVLITARLPEDAIMGSDGGIAICGWLAASIPDITMSDSKQDARPHDSTKNDNNASKGVSSLLSHTRLCRAPRLNPTDSLPPRPSQCALVVTSRNNTTTAVAT